MDKTKPRKTGAIEFIAKHLESAAYQALVNSRQSEVARTLGEADSTVMRRAAGYISTMRQLAATKIRDFVFDGEMKLPVEQYRHMLWIQLEYSRLKLEITDKEKASEGESFEA
ncbi:hypothetical protein ACU6ZE_10615 [Klebsiella aerogenes]|uniref:hypothetical protein n=1 Tax=Klebsiella aerogenes TaxID=548 RepID=UPI00397B367B|nr:hypothetical protein [Klebsiella aerogenes]